MKTKVLDKKFRNSIEIDKVVRFIILEGNIEFLKKEEIPYIIHKTPESAEKLTFIVLF